MAHRRPVCNNRNHSRQNAPVRFCPSCGEVVNQNVSRKECSMAHHADRTKQRDRYCVDCGIGLT